MFEKRKALRMARKAAQLAQSLGTSHEYGWSYRDASSGFVVTLLKNGFLFVYDNLQLVLDIDTSSTRLLAFQPGRWCRALEEVAANALLPQSRQSV